MNVDGAKEEEEGSNNGEEAMCYLLDASHTLAVSSLGELKHGTEPQAIIHYLKPLSTFLRLISSLCASSSMVQSIITSEFLPEGLLAQAMSVVGALAPLVSSLNGSGWNGEEVSAEERSTVRYATTVLSSLSTLAYLGGARAREWIRSSLTVNNSSASATGPARMLCTIASQVLPTASHAQNALEEECAGLASAALNLLVDLLGESEISFQMETMACFSSGFAPYVGGGMQSEVTLAAMSILNCLSVNLVQNSFDPIGSASGMLSAHIETIGGGVMTALDVLSTLVSGGEVNFPASKLQVSTSHAILSSAVAALVALKQVMYLHQDDAVRSVALAVRDNILRSLTSSTPLGQAVAFLSSAPLSLALSKKTSQLKELSRVLDTSAEAYYYRENNGRDGGGNGTSGKYGAWGRFVTPRRASQRVSKHKNRASVAGIFSEDVESVKDDASSDGLYGVVVMALSLLLVWGENAEDVAHGYLPEQVVGANAEQQNLLLQHSPCNLMLSKASPSSLQPALTAGLNVANLNIISRFASADDVLVGGSKSNAALLSSKLVKMCLRHANTIALNDNAASNMRIGLSAFRAALGGGSHIFEILLGAFDKLSKSGDGASEAVAYFECMEQLALMVTTLLEAVAVSVSSQPDLCRAILLGGENAENWGLIEKMVSMVLTTSNLLTSSRETENNTPQDDHVLGLHCLISCAILNVVAELWKSCRLTATASDPKSSWKDNSSVHACGIIVSHLTNINKNTGRATTPSLLIANIVELTRCSLLSIMSLEEKNSMLDEVSASIVHQKCILLDLLTTSLDIVTLETVSRVQTKSLGGLKLVKDLFESGPMECWKVLLSSGDGAPATAASSWLEGFSSSLGRSNAPNWNLALFLQANPREEDASTSTWCAFGPASRLAKALSPATSNNVRMFRQCNALHALTTGEASFSASWCTFFEVVMANVIATRPRMEVFDLARNLVEITLMALSSVTESQMISESLLSSQGLLESRDTKPIGDLCSLLLYSLSVRRDFVAEESASNNSQSMLEMIERLHGSANKFFVMTQLGSVSPSSHEAVCSIRQNMLTCALILVSDFESFPQGGLTRDDVVKYNDLRIGFTDLAVNALQSLQYVQLGATSDDSDVTVANAEIMAPSKYGYGFGAASESRLDASLLAQEAAFQLLSVSLSLLSRLAPTATKDSGSNVSDYQTYSYGVDFAACLKARNAMENIQYHLITASTVASLTYQAVHDGSSSHSVAVIHNNAVDISHLIITYFHELTDSGMIVVDILLLLIENRCFRSLIDSPLLKAASKMWTLESEMTGNEVMPTISQQHRGYYTSLPRHALENATSKSRPSSQKDSVHFIWREVIHTFSSLVRSARCQIQTYAKVDESILRNLTPVTSLVLDFVCTYENEIFSCFSSMLTEARAQSNLTNRAGKTKSSSFSSSIQSSSFAFTLNLLKESANVSLLFAELCKGDNKNEFARQCRGIYDRVLSTSLELSKIMSSFLGSIGNARELFLALSSASAIMLNQPMAMFDAHPLLAEGIPNARHEAIRNAHFAHSCCILATAEDFTNSHIATTKAAETSGGKDKSLEQSFQIQVNNKFIAEVEQIAGHCLFNALDVLSNTHPASDSFISFSNEEALRLDISAVITPGTTVAIRAQNGVQQYLGRYLIQPQGGGDLRYARAIGCDRSTRTISVKYADTNTVEKHVPWSWIVGMEDTSKRQCIFSYLPTPKSMVEADTRGPPSLGHLILALKWCRHVGLTSLDNSNNCPMHIVKCVAESAAILLCTEVLVHEEMQDFASRDDTVRRVNMQLLDLFDYADAESEGLNPKVAMPQHQGDKSLALAIGDDILGIIQMNLKSQLRAASVEQEEERKIWEQNNVNTGWDSSSWASSSKRQGRRSPFRMMRKQSSDLS